MAPSPVDTQSALVHGLRCHHVAQWSYSSHGPKGVAVVFPLIPRHQLQPLPSHHVELLSTCWTRVLSDKWAEISEGADHSKPQDKKGDFFLIPGCSMHKPTLFTKSACIYIVRFGISVTFLRVSVAACESASSATGRIRFEKDRKEKGQIWTSHVISILPLTLEALQRRPNITRLLIKVRRAGSSADIYGLGNTFFCF